MAAESKSALEKLNTSSAINGSTPHVIQPDDRSEKIVKTISYAFTFLFAIICIFPFVLIISSSFTDERSIVLHGFGLIPHTFSTNAYDILFNNVGQIVGSYVATISITVVGTTVGLFLMTMTGYALQRQDFKYRNIITFYIFFTTLFQAGLIPFYMLITQTFKLQDSYLAILFPLMMTPWLIILMKNFLKTIPHSITESAKIDGANDFHIFLKIILAMSKPALATVGLFLALSYWNEWFHAMLFLTSRVQYTTLQLFLYKTVNEAQYLRESAAASQIPPTDVPMESMKMATAVIATGPIIFAYPFVQRFFIRGIAIGAVKG